MATSRSKPKCTRLKRSASSSPSSPSSSVEPTRSVNSNVTTAAATLSSGGSGLGGCRLPAAPECFCELARLVRRGDPELVAQPLAQPLVRPDRTGAIAGGGEASHQIAQRHFSEPVEGHLPTRVRDGLIQCALAFGIGREPGEDAGHAVAMLVTALVHPVVVQAGEQLAARYDERVLRTSLGDAALELSQVGPDERVPRKTHLVPAGNQVLLAAGAERASQRRQAHCEGLSARSRRGHRARSERRASIEGASCGRPRASRAERGPAGSTVAQLSVPSTSIVRSPSTRTRSMPQA